MAWRELDQEEIEALLLSERIVRVAFATLSERYVVPLGYVWCEGSLWGTTRRGHKTELAAMDERVAFAVDDSATSVPFGWRSCLGQGDFELVKPEVFNTYAGDKMAAMFPDNPRWNRREWVIGLREGTSVCWRIVPRSLSGRIPIATD